MKYDKDLIIIGAGPAGLAAALSSKENGCTNILIIERSQYMGGILNQCIHNGFGLHTFHQELTGPEYAARYEKSIQDQHIPISLNTMVLSIAAHSVTYVNQTEGLVTLTCHAIILAMGCRERPRGALNIPGYRPSGIYPAGTAQQLMNIEGKSVGKRIVILGSGDIGLIMARRLTLEGSKVLAVAEIMPYSGGLKRNIVQCLDDFHIPLYLSHTITQIEGKKRVEGVTLQKVGTDRKPIEGTTMHFDCDTLLLSVGLIPENELSIQAHVALSPITHGPLVDDTLQTSVAGIFACGNVLHVHDLVDFVSEEAALAGKMASDYVKNGEKQRNNIPLHCKNGVRYSVPQSIDPLEMEQEITIRFRVTDVFHNRSVALYANKTLLKKIKKKILAPGEMETITIKKTQDIAWNEVQALTIQTEETV